MSKAKGEALAGWFDGRVGLFKMGKANLRKVFPDHWSFLIGEIALYTFIIIILTGVYLTLFFEPAMNEVVYRGRYEPLNGIRMSQAFESTMDISFDVRGGLLMRQIHHWAAVLFIASMIAHMMRTFFTGVFRKPREINWLSGAGLLILGMFDGFMGYSLPDDLLSGTGLRFMQGAMLSVPIVGTYLSFFFFGGEFPGTTSSPGCSPSTSFCCPGSCWAWWPLHMILVVYHKHTQCPGPGRRSGCRRDAPLGRSISPRRRVLLPRLRHPDADGGIAQINPSGCSAPTGPTWSPRTPSPTGTWGTPRA